jgi:hypothetical protein
MQSEARDKHFPDADREAVLFGSNLKAACARRVTGCTDMQAMNVRDAQTP